MEIEAEEDDFSGGEKYPPLCGDRLKYILETLGRVKTEVSKPGGYMKATRNGWIFPNEPAFMEKGIDANKYSRPKLFVWLPREFPGVKIKCPNCSSTETIPDGWPDKPPARRVIGLDECYFVVGRRQLCKRCKKKFNSYNPKVLSQIPYRFRMLFTARLTHRSGIDLNLLQLLRNAAAESFGFQSFRNMLIEAHMRRYHEKALAYHELICIHSSYVSKKTSFPDFKSPEYGGFIPSSRYLADTYLEYMEEHEPQLLAQLAKVSADTISVDHSHKVLLNYGFLYDCILKY
jgi:hypothetical protein